MIRKILTSIRYRYTDFRIILVAVFGVPWELHKDGEFNLGAMIFTYIVFSVPAFFSIFIVTFFDTGKTLTELKEEVDQLENELDL